MGSLGRLRARDRGVRIGLIGCGYIAEQVHLPVWKEVAKAKIVCCVDKVEERANSLAKEFGIKSVYTDIQAMLDGQQQLGMHHRGDFQEPSHSSRNRTCDSSV
jgi:hypothetical protein